MRQKRIALLACSNGMGHVRRMLTLGLALREAGARPVMLAEGRKLARLEHAYGVVAPELIDFASRTKFSDWMAASGPAWIEDLPSLDGYDEVVSDNLVEVLERRPDAWLSGSFFWHRALNGFPADRAAHADFLLHRHRPRMVTSSLFSSAYLAASTRLTEVGLYAFPGSVASSDGGNDILMACGTGGGADAEARALLQEIAVEPRPPCGTLWVEPGIHEIGMPAWIQAASFTPAMYAGLMCAVIRPGVGTATDVLLAGARLFSFYESGNDEMRVNAAKSAAAGVGEDCGNARQAWQAALRFMGDARLQAQHRAAAQTLDRGGARQTASLILQGVGPKLSDLHPLEPVGQ